MAPESQNDQKLSENQKLEFKDTKKNSCSTQNRSTLKVRLEGNIQNNHSGAI